MERQRPSGEPERVAIQPGRGGKSLGRAMRHLNQAPSGLVTSDCGEGALLLIMLKQSLEASRLLAPAAVLVLASCATDDELHTESADALTAREFRTTGLREDLSGGRAAQGREFLHKNATAAGVKTRPSGLQFLVLHEGDGELPSLRDTVTTRYRVTTFDGRVLDDSDDYGGPQDFRVDQVIAGWREALQEMRVGSKWKLFLPPELAYGDRGMAQIPGGETLIYELELVGLQRGSAAAALGEVARPEEMDPDPDVAPAARPPADSPSTPLPSGDLSLDNLDLLE